MAFREQSQVLLLALNMTSSILAEPPPQTQKSTFN